MNSYGQTDTGRVRKSNQDSIFLSETPVGPLSNLFMVADGMGGHKAGDFASRFVVDTMVRCMGLYKSDSPVTALRKAIEKTNELLFLEAQRIRTGRAWVLPWWPLPWTRIPCTWPMWETAACIFSGTA